MLPLRLVIDTNVLSFGCDKARRITADGVAAGRDQAGAIVHFAVYL